MPIASSVSDSAAKLIDTRTAAETFSALRVVYLSSETDISVADKDSEAEARAYGVALQAATSIGDEIDVLTYGILEDAFFTYSAGTILFLSDDGAITDVPPSSGFSVQIGKGLGTGAIFVDIERPIEII